MNTPNNKSELRSSNKNELSTFSVPEVLYNNRYCNQDDFNILICGGRNHGKPVRNCFLINPFNFSKTKELPSMLEPRYYCQTVAISSDLFVAGGYSSDGKSNSIEMFSYKNKAWKNIDFPLNKLYKFCVCSFNKMLYIIGSGIIEDIVQKYTCCCSVYDVKTGKWSQKAETNAVRTNSSSCTVFEGKIVVTGGIYSCYSVEAYDHHKSRWSYLPPMIEKRRWHASVSMGNKLFVIGGKKSLSCELFSSRSRKFVYLKHSLNIQVFHKSFLRSVCIGDKIVVCVMSKYGLGTKICTYDVCKQKWLYCDSKFSTKYTAISCTKNPMQ